MRTTTRRKNSKKESQSLVSLKLSLSLSQKLHTRINCSQVLQERSLLTVHLSASGEVSILRHTLATGASSPQHIRPLLRQLQTAPPHTSPQTVSARQRLLVPCSSRRRHAPLLPTHEAAEASLAVLRARRRVYDIRTSATR